MSPTYRTLLEHEARSVWSEVEPLAEALFGEDHYAERVAFQNGLCLVVAYADGRVVGFKVGYLDRPRRFTSWLGGVDPDWRGQGIGAQLMRLQHEHIGAIGCSRIWTITSDAYQPMIRLNLAHGFRIIGTYTNRSGVPKLILEKVLEGA